MPPKKKKLDPEEQKVQFEEWKKTEEYELMGKINEEMQKMPKEGRISSTD